MISAEVLTIGDEILFGQITDTNTQWISAELTKIGVRTVRKTSVGDSRTAILEAFEEASKRVKIVIVTGGLGPTKDDITKKTFCEFFDTTLEINESALALITSFFVKRGRDMTELNRQQAAVPKNCIYIENRWGTAPGMWFDEKGVVWVSLPGVPFEMKNLMTNRILPMLQAHFKTPTIYHRMIRTVGIGESFLAERIEQWEDALPENIKLAYLPHFGQVRLRLTATGDELEALKTQTEAEVKKVLPLIGDAVFGFDTDELETVVGSLLANRKQTLSTAESCTGGYVAHKLTSVAGCSAYFMGSVVAYSYELKTSELGVQQATLDQHGAVSEQTVTEMADGARKRLKTDWAVATSGIAGPDGGTPDKPVGTIWIACAGPNGTTARKLHLTKYRELNIQLTATYVLDLLRKQILLT